MIAPACLRGTEILNAIKRFCLYRPCISKSQQPMYASENAIRHIRAIEQGKLATVRRTCRICRMRHTPKSKSIAAYKARYITRHNQGQAPSHKEASITASSNDEIGDLSSCNLSNSSLWFLVGELQHRKGFFSQRKMKNLLFFLTCCVCSVASATPPSTESVERLLALSKADQVLEVVYANMEQSMRQGMQAATGNQPLTPKQQKALQAVPQKMSEFLRAGLY